MKVEIKKLRVSMDLGNNGIEFGVYRGGKYLGDLHIGKAKVTWCKGKAHKGKKNEKKKKWTDLITFFEKEPNQV